MTGRTQAYTRLSYASARLHAKPLLPVSWQCWRILSSGPGKGLVHISFLFSSYLALSISNNSEANKKQTRSKQEGNKKETRRKQEGSIKERAAIDAIVFLSLGTPLSYGQIWK